MPVNTTRHFLAAGVALALLPFAAGPAAGQVTPPTRGIIFVANGAGDSWAASESLTNAVDDLGLPFCVETVEWSQANFLEDLWDRANHRAAGRHLARQICQYRQAHPGDRVVLLSHSAGAAVVLAAVECAPPGFVDRVILLAPGTSKCYDLRPALWRVRESIDAFISYADTVLEVVAPLIGTTDGVEAPAAGQVGFGRVGNRPEDLALYTKLHQYGWSPDLEWTCHQGGHYGWLRARYVQAYLLPLVIGADRCPRPIPAPR
jgi:pimeloyl-ACP methyl ester carboxylesterase